MPKPYLYPLILDDANRNLSRRPGQSNDCTVRALAIATGISYDQIYDELARAGRKPCDGFDLTAYLARRRSFLGHPFRRVTFRRHITIQHVMTVQGPTPYIIELYDHVFAVVQCKARDLWRRPPDEKVFGLWLF